MAHNGDIDWASIITRGVESIELDYKAAQDWGRLSRIGRAKFVRHCLALANTKGGYIVIGVGEDTSGKPALFTGLTEAETKSFDPTDVGNFVNRFADPAVDFDLERPVVDGRQYVVFVVRRFSGLPHVCTANCEGELQQGAFYIRTQDAASRIAYRASEIHAIVQRALRNQREMLGRMIRGVLYESQGGEESEHEQFFLAQARDARDFFRKRVLPKGDAEVVFGMLAYPPDFTEETFSLSQVRRAVDNSLYTFRDIPFAAMGTDVQTYFTNTALRSCLPEHGVFWHAYQSGLFQYFGIAGTREAVPYPALVQLIAEAVFFLGQYYTELGYTDEILTLGVELGNVEGAHLAVPRDLGGQRDYVCRIERIRVQKRRSAADLASGADEHSARMVREICERFNFPAGRHGDLRARIGNHLARHRQ